MIVRIVDSAIDISTLRLSVNDPGAGAILVFEGVTRDHFEGRKVVRLEYEAYRPMAEREMQAIIDDAQTQWEGVRIAITHRVGLVPLGETSVGIAVSAPHRDAAYLASRFAIDRLKERVPIWKKEVYSDGSTWKANAEVNGGLRNER